MEGRKFERSHGAAQGGDATCGKRRRGERGSIAPLFLGLVAVLLTIGLAIMSISDSQSRSITDDAKRQSAISLAEGGVDHVLWRLRQTPDAQLHFGPSWRTLADEQDVALDGGTYYLSNLDTDASGDIKGIRMQGWVPNRADAKAVMAEVYVEVKKIGVSLFNGAAVGNTYVYFEGSPVIDSYKSSNGSYATGPKYSNGDVIVNNPANYSCYINGSPSIKGHGYYPNGGSFSTFFISGSGLPTQGISKNPNDATFQAIPPILANAKYIKPIIGATGDVSFVTTANVTIAPPIPAGTYVITKDAYGVSLDIDYGGRLRIAGTGSTVIYLEGNADIQGYGILNAGLKPTNLQIYGMAACTSLTYNSTSTYGGVSGFYGAIYAPAADIPLYPYCQYYGSFVGNRVGGGANTIHYDEDLKTGVGGASPGYQMTSWTQVR